MGKTEFLGSRYVPNGYEHCCSQISLPVETWGIPRSVKEVKMPDVVERAAGEETTPAVEAPLRDASLALQS